MVLLGASHLVLLANEAKDLLISCVGLCALIWEEGDLAWVSGSRAVSPVNKHGVDLTTLNVISSADTPKNHLPLLLQMPLGQMIIWVGLGPDHPI